jgi:nitrilase
MERPGTVRVAVVQASPVLFDRERTMEKALGLIAEAAEKGAKLVLFPEAYIPCYPRGLSFGFAIGSRTEEGRKDFQRFHDNCVAVPGPDVDRLARAAGEKGVYLAMGRQRKERNELDGTLNCCGSSSVRRQLLGRTEIKPTGSERYIWGETTQHPDVVDTDYAKWRPDLLGDTCPSPGRLIKGGQALPRPDRGPA